MARILLNAVSIVDFICVVDISEQEKEIGKGGAQTQINWLAHKQRLNDLILCRSLSAAGNYLNACSLYRSTRTPEGASKFP